MVLSSNSISYTPPKVAEPMHQFRLTIRRFRMVMLRVGAIVPEWFMLCNNNNANGNGNGEEEEKTQTQFVSEMAMLQDCCSVSASFFVPSFLPNTSYLDRNPVISHINVTRIHEDVLARIGI